MIAVGRIRIRLARDIRTESCDREAAASSENANTKCQSGNEGQLGTVFSSTPPTFSRSRIVAATQTLPVAPLGSTTIVYVPCVGTMYGPVLEHWHRTPRSFQLNHQ